MRAPPRAYHQSDRLLELLCSPTSTSTLSPSSRPRASSTDGHHHRRRRCQHRLRDRRAVVILIIAAAGADCTIVAVVVEVSLSSPTSERRRHAKLHRRSHDTVTDIADAIIDDASGRADATRIMSSARQVAGGRVACLREHWRGQLQVRQNYLHRKDCTT